jgi:hypothetical protein
MPVAIILGGTIRHDAGQAAGRDGVAIDAQRRLAPSGTIEVFEVGHKEGGSVGSAVMDWSDFSPKMMEAVATLVTAFAALQTARIATAKKSEGPRGGEKANQTASPNVKKQLRNASDRSTWKSPWQLMTKLDRLAFLLDQALIFGGLATLWLFVGVFKPEPLDTRTGALLITLGAVVVMGTLRRRD